MRAEPKPPAFGSKGVPMLARASALVLSALLATPAFASSECEDVEASPDWDRAFRYTPKVSGDRLVIDFEVAPCFHAYGPKTESGQPLSVELTGEAFAAAGPAKVPEGVIEEGPFGRRIVIRGKGRIVLPIEKKDAEASRVKAKLHYHVCTDNACGPPRHVAISAKVG